MSNKHERVWFVILRGPDEPDAFSSAFTNRKAAKQYKKKKLESTNIYDEAVVTKRLLKDEPRDDVSR